LALGKEIQGSDKLSAVTDWLTSIGTISAVVTSLAYYTINPHIEKRRKRRDLILKTIFMSEKLFHEIDSIKIDRQINDISKLRSYNQLKIYLNIASYSRDFDNEDVLMLGENLFGSLGDYYENKNENNKKNCLDFLKQLKEIK
jgi:hypothetical protein